MDYTLLRGLHIFFVLLWFGGLIVNGIAIAYLARHPQALDAGALMRLHLWDRWISNPAQGLVFIVGITLIAMGGWFPDGWLIAKLALVILLAAIHGTQSATLRKLARGQAASKRQSLVRNSIYVVIAAALLIVLLVVLKPF